MITAILVPILCFIFGFSKHWLIRRRAKEAHRAFSDYHGCLPAPRLHCQSPLGIDRIVQLLRAAGEGQVLETLSCHFRQTANTFEHVLFGTSGFATIEPENIAALLGPNKGFGIEPRDKVLKKPFGEGIFAEKDMHWKHSRDTIRDQFRRSRYSDLSVFQRTVDNLLQSLRAHGDVIDLQPLFSRMTLDITTEFVLGESAQSLVALEGTDSQKFSDAFDIVQKQATAQMRRFNLHWLRDDRYCQAQRDLNHFTDQMIDRNLNLALGGDTGSTHSEFLLAIAQETRDRTAIRGQVLHLLVAGRDTTASLLSWTIFLLVRHPHVMQKLRTEIALVCGTDPVLSRDKLRRLRYLQNILNETLRLFPAVPVNYRTAREDTWLPCGGGADGKSPIFVPKGKTVIFHPYAMHRRPDIYGMDAALFCPERWEVFTPPKWGYIPFGAGVRVCLGRDFALTVVAYTIVRLLQEFASIKLPDGETIELVGAEQQALTLVMSIGKGCRVLVG